MTGDQLSTTTPELGVRRAQLDSVALADEEYREIVRALGRVDYLLCAISTCGTLRGCAEYVREHALQTRIIAVDAVGSVIFGKRGPRLLTGHGAGVRPALFQPGLCERCVHVTDSDCVAGCRRLVRR